MHRRDVADGEHAAERAARAHGEGAAQARAEEERLAEVERGDDSHVVDAEPLRLPEEAVVLLDLVPALGLGFGLGLGLGSTSCLRAVGDRGEAARGGGEWRRRVEAASWRAPRRHRQAAPAPHGGAP